MTRKGLLLLVAASAAFVLAVPASAATQPRPGSLSIQRDADAILWAEVSVWVTDAVVTIHFRAPTKDGRSVLWQRCRFDHASEGTYRCGIDVAEGSLASKRRGTWIAHAAVGGVPVGQRSFTTAR